MNREHYTCTFCGAQEHEVEIDMAASGELRGGEFVCTECAERRALEAVDEALEEQEQREERSEQ